MVNYYFPVMLDTFGGFVTFSQVSELPGVDPLPHDPPPATLTEANQGAPPMETSSILS